MKNKSFELKNFFKLFIHSWKLYKWNKNLSLMIIKEHILI